MELAEYKKFSHDGKLPRGLLLKTMSEIKSEVNQFLALKKLDLSVAFAFSSLNYALVMIASIVLLKEKISLSKIIGTSIIVIGKLLFNIKF